MSLAGHAGSAPKTHMVLHNYLTSVPENPVPSSDLKREHSHNKQIILKLDLKKTTI